MQSIGRVIKSFTALIIIRKLSNFTRCKRSALFEAIKRSHAALNRKQYSFTLYKNILINNFQVQRGKFSYVSRVKLYNWVLMFSFSAKAIRTLFSRTLFYNLVVNSKLYINIDISTTCVRNLTNV